MKQTSHNEHSTKLNTLVKDERFIVGCMTGTSVDGLDVALVKITGHGLDIKAEFITGTSFPIGKVGAKMKSLAISQKLNAQSIAEATNEMAKLHVKAIRKIIKQHEVDLIVVHGQTVYHNPPISWQLIDPAVIAYSTNTRVLYNLRSADLASGGQGAPITPLADFILFRHDKFRRCIINLGGFCNFTLLYSGNQAVLGDKHNETWKSLVRGGDICVCNQLLDKCSEQLLSLPFDPEGKFAATGVINYKLFNELTELLMGQAHFKRSLGTGDELFDWVVNHLEDIKEVDILRTVCAAIATVITKKGPYDQLIFAGGGVKNETLMNEIRARTTKEVLTTDQFGIPIEYREAVCMAVLGALCEDRYPITLSEVTGVLKPPIAGHWVLP